MDRRRFVGAEVLAWESGERCLAQSISCALEEANDLVFCGAVGVKETVAMEMHVAAEERAGWPGDLSGFCELIQPVGGRAYFMTPRGKSPRQRIPAWLLTEMPGIA